MIELFAICIGVTVYALVLAWYLGRPRRVTKIACRTAERWRWEQREQR